MLSEFFFFCISQHLLIILMILTSISKMLSLTSKLIIVSNITVWIQFLYNKNSKSLRVWLLFIRLELKTSQKGNIKMLKCTFLDLHYCLSTAFQYVWICDSVQYKWECVWNRNSLAFWAAERTNVILIGGSTNVICINVTRMKV